jgi:anti-sigma B factor antagonist
MHATVYEAFPVGALVKSPPASSHAEGKKSHSLTWHRHRSTMPSVAARLFLHALFRRYMPIKMETDISGDVVILYCSGRLVFGDETAAFRDRINHILLGAQQIVVNLSGVEYVDSGGLGTLVGTLASTRNRHGEIKLVRPNQRVTELLLRTRLNTVFKSYESDDEAVAAFHANA